MGHLLHPYANMSSLGMVSPGNRTGIDWATWTETISHLYVVENHTAEEVSFEMWALYGVRVA